MKKIPLIPSLLAAAFPLAANAAILVSEPFVVGGGASDYTAGNLGTQNPTTPGMTGGWRIGNVNHTVQATGLNYSDPLYSAAASGGSVSGVNSGRVGRDLSTTYGDSSDDTVYVSFLMQLATGAPDGYRAFEAHDGDGFNDGANREFQLGAHTGDFGTATNFGIRLDNNGTYNAPLGVLNADVNLFVVKFDFSSTGPDTVTAWQNPDLSTGLDPAGGVTMSTAGADTLEITSLTFARFSNQGVVWDELRVGDTFADVTIPEPGTGIVTGLAGLMLVFRRRR